MAGKANEIAFRERSAPRKKPKWRRCLLALSLLVLTFMCVVNAIALYWILRLLGVEIKSAFLSPNLLSKTYLQLNKNVHFSKGIQVSNIESEKNNSLHLASSNAIVLSVFDSKGNTFNRLTLDKYGLTSISNKFRFLNGNEQEILSIEPNKISLSAEELQIKGFHGSVFKKGITTPLIEAPIGKTLRVQSLTSKLFVESDQLLLQSAAGDINILNMDDIIIQSNTGKVLIDNQKGVYLLNLPKYTIPRSDKLNLKDKNALQICMCKNGALFASLPDDNCQTVDYSFCSL